MKLVPISLGHELIHAVTKVLDVRVFVGWIGHAGKFKWIQWSRVDLLADFFNHWHGTNPSSRLFGLFGNLGFRTLHQESHQVRDFG